MDNTYFIRNIAANAIKFRAQNVVAEIDFAKMLLTEMDNSLEQIVGESLMAGNFESISEQISMLVMVREYALQYGSKFNAGEIKRRMFGKSDLYEQLEKLSKKDFKGNLRINGQEYIPGGFAETLYHLSSKDMLRYSDTEMAIRQRKQKIASVRKDLFKGVSSLEKKELTFAWDEIANNLLAMTFIERAFEREYAFKHFNTLSRINWIRNDPPLNGKLGNYDHEDVMAKLKNRDNLLSVLREIYPGDFFEAEIPIFVMNPHFEKFTKMLQLGLDYFKPTNQQELWFRYSSESAKSMILLEGDVRNSAKNLLTSKSGIKTGESLAKQLRQNQPIDYLTAHGFAKDVLMMYR